MSTVSKIELNDHSYAPTRERENTVDLSQEQGASLSVVRPAPEQHKSYDHAEEKSAVQQDDVNATITANQVLAEMRKGQEQVAANAGLADLEKMEQGARDAQIEKSKEQQTIANHDRTAQQGILTTNQYSEKVGLFVQNNLKEKEYKEMLDKSNNMNATGQSKEFEKASKEAEQKARHNVEEKARNTAKKLYGQEVSSVQVNISNKKSSKPQDSVSIKLKDGQSVSWDGMDATQSMSGQIDNFAQKKEKEKEKEPDEKDAKKAKVENLRGTSKDKGATQTKVQDKEQQKEQITVDYQLAQARLAQSQGRSK